MEVESRECAMQLTKKEVTGIHKQHWKPVSTSERKLKKPNVTSAALLHTGSSSSNPCCLFLSPSHKLTICKESAVTTRKQKLKEIREMFQMLGTTTHC